MNAAYYIHASRLLSIPLCAVTHKQAEAVKWNHMAKLYGSCDHRSRSIPLKDQTSGTRRYVCDYCKKDVTNAPWVQKAGAAMDKDAVLSLMKSSKNDAEWDANCDKVKAAHGGGYPQYWFTEVVLSGLMDHVLGQGASTITVRAI